MPLDVKELVCKWIIENTRPSNNVKNVVKYKEGEEKVEYLIYWWENSIEEYFEMCVQHLHLDGILHKTTFWKLIPDFVLPVRCREGLCPYHHLAEEWARELERKRHLWHHIGSDQYSCSCQCVFCTDCNHGKTPSGEKGVRCAMATCSACKYQKCPVEWTPHFDTVWVVTLLEKRTGGGAHYVEQKTANTREKLMKTWSAEMASFHKHDTKATWIKKVVDEIKEKLPLGHVLIKGDFIQNYVHSRGAETALAY